MYHDLPGALAVDSGFLFASLLWGSVGVGYFIYGKKQREIVPIIGGAVMVGVAYLVTSWVFMSLCCLALMVVVYLLIKRGG